MKKNMNKKGLTLIEIITVVGIITILSGATFFTVKAYTKNVNEVAEKAANENSALEEARQQVAQPLMITTLSSLDVKRDTSAAGNTQSSINNTQNSQSAANNSGSSSTINTTTPAPTKAPAKAPAAPTSTPAPTATPVPTTAPTAAPTQAPQNNSNSVSTAATISGVSNGYQHYWSDGSNSYGGGGFNVSSVTTGNISYIDVKIPAGATVNIQGATVTDMGNGVYRYSGTYFNPWHIGYTTTIPSGVVMNADTFGIVGYGS